MNCGRRVPKSPQFCSGSCETDEGCDPSQTGIPIDELGLITEKTSAPGWEAMVPLWRGRGACAPGCYGRSIRSWRAGIPIPLPPKGRRKGGAKGVYSHGK